MNAEDLAELRDLAGRARRRADRLRWQATTAMDAALDAEREALALERRLWRAETGPLVFADDASPPR